MSMASSWRKSATIALTDDGYDARVELKPLLRAILGHSKPLIETLPCGGHTVERVTSGAT
jgi:hypothetical protein